MKSVDLGRLEKVDLREAWISESGDFTPWLAEEANIKLLGDTIGLELEVEGVEMDVGPFRADIQCKSIPDGGIVVIENQLEKTDHNHLGQLMTYAAGLEAATTVWVAKSFTDEHRAALDWLNEATRDGINFFGLEVELWRIGNSAIAPKFNVVSRPNDWVDTRGPSGLSPTQEMQQEFWIAFHSFGVEHGTKLKLGKPAPAHWMNVSLGRSGYNLVGVASTYNGLTNRNTGEIRAEVYIGGASAKEYFGVLESRKDEIETELSEVLIWYNNPGAQSCRIYLRTDADISNHDDWPGQHAWLLEKLEALHRVFAPRVKNLLPYASE